MKNKIGKWIFNLIEDQIVNNVETEVMNWKNQFEDNVDELGYRLDSVESEMEEKVTEGDVDSMIDNMRNDIQYEIDQVGEKIEKVQDLVDELEREDILKVEEYVRKSLINIGKGKS